MKKILLLLALVGVVLLSAAPVLADDGFYVIAGGGKAGTPINSVPYTISSSGVYYLNGNLTSTSTTQNGISVNASDVTLDLMGFTLTGPGTSEVNEGIRVQNDASNVEIRNGSIKSFGDTGIYAENCTGVRIIGIRVRNMGASGIWLSGNDHLVMGCSVMNTQAYGIRAYNSCMIKGNHTTGNSSGTGIVAGSGSTVAGNMCISEGIFTFDNCTITNNTSHGLTNGSNCTLAQNTTY